MSNAKFRRLVLALPFRSVYDGEVTETEIETSEETGNDNPPANPPAKKKAENVQFTPEQQAYVNSLMAEEKRKAKKKNDELITQLQTKINEAGTTAAEKASLEDRIDQLKSEYQTKEETAAKTAKKKIKETEEKLTAAEQRAVIWEQRFQTKTIDIELTQAAVEGKAYNAKQVVTILKPNTKLVEVRDDDGKPTGEFLPKVSLPTKDKDGKPTILEFSPSEAVKQLQENPEEYGNLFISGASGGLGSGTLAGRKTGEKLDPSKMDTEQYIAERRKSRKAGRGS